MKRQLVILSAAVVAALCACLMLAAVAAYVYIDSLPPRPTPDMTFAQPARYA